MNGSCRAASKAECERTKMVVEIVPKMPTLQEEMESAVCQE